MYLNAIEVMSILAMEDQRKTWRVSHWTLPEYNVWIFLVSNAASGTPSALQTRIAVWGLEYGVFSVSLFRRYNPLFVKLIWQDDNVGTLIDSYRRMMQKSQRALGDFKIAFHASVAATDTPTLPSVAATILYAESFRLRIAQCEALDAGSGYLSSLLTQNEARFQKLSGPFNRAN